jgi:hypothetical protein
LIVAPPRLLTRFAPCWFLSKKPNRFVNENERARNRFD